MPDCGDIITIGTRRFRLGEVIGAGGFGVVLAGRETDRSGGPLGPDLAIKLVDRIKMAEHQKTHADGTRSARKHFVAALEGEIAALRMLQSRHGDLHRINVVRLVHAGTMEFAAEPGRPFPALVMQRYPMSLAHVLGAGPGACLDARDRLLTVDGLLAFLADMANALAALAASGDAGRQLAHRDIKPSNILENDGAYLLTDFGNAKEFDDLTESVGGVTESYVAPELWTSIRRKEDGAAATGRVALARVDVFSLGMTMVKLLTGGVPWRQTDRHLSGAADLLGDHGAKLRDAVAALPVQAALDRDETVLPGPAPDPAMIQAIRSGLEALVREMVRVDPAGRPDPRTLRRRIDDLRARRRQPAAGPGVPRPPAAIVPSAAAGRRRRRRPVLAAGIVALATLSVSATAMVLPQRVMTPVPVTPLAVPGPARWSGLAQDYAQTLCPHTAGPSLAMGEKIVAQFTLSPRWLADPPRLTAVITGDARPPVAARCTATDADRLTWQCVGATDGPTGSARLIVTDTASRATATAAFHVLPQGIHCPVTLAQRR